VTAEDSKSLTAANGERISAKAPILFSSNTEKPSAYILHETNKVKLN
jgi:hypothetical protein